MKRPLFLVPAFLLLPLSGFSQTASDSNVAAKLTGHLVPHAQIGRAVREAPTPPCSSGEANLATAGTQGVLYDLFVLLQDVTVAFPPDAVTFRIEYEPVKADRGLEIVAWESLVGTQVQHPNVNGEDWPAPGSGITLVMGGEEPVKRSPLDPEDRGTRVLGRFLVQAYGDAVFRFTTSSPAMDGKGSVQSPVMIHDPTGIQSLASPDDLGEVAFGQGSTGYDPCKEGATGLGVSSAEVKLETQGPLAVLSQRNPSERRVEWTVTSSKVRSAKVALYSVSGRLVKRWGSVNLSQGTTRIVWDGLNESGSGASSGVYYLELTSDDGYRVVTKAVLIRQ